MSRARSGAGSKYQGIILDPPKYGRGPTGEVWRLFEDMPGLLKDCAALLADDASFLLLNAYAARISGMSLAHLMARGDGGSRRPHRLGRTGPVRGRSGSPRHRPQLLRPVVGMSA